MANISTTSHTTNNASPSGLAATRASLQRQWASLGAREQRGLGIAATVVALAVLWWLLLAPALHTLQTAQRQHADLERDMEHMLRLQNQARALQAQPALNAAAALAALKSAIQPISQSAALQVVGEQVTLTFTKVSAAGLAQWLAQLGTPGNPQPAEMHLVREVAANDADPTWSGTVRFTLPNAAAN